MKILNTEFTNESLDEVNANSSKDDELKQQINKFFEK